MASSAARVRPSTRGASALRVALGIVLVIAAWPILMIVIGFLTGDSTGFKALRREARENLTQLAAAQERYRAGHGVYAESLATLIAAADSTAGFHPAAALDIRIVAAGDSGWSATLTHPRGLTCGIFAGRVTPPLPSTTREGQPGC